MSGRILYRGVSAADAHPLHPGTPSPTAAPGQSPLGQQATNEDPATSPRPPSEGEEAELLDPRIQVELEKLNKASEDINRLELQLDEARARFRQVLTDSTQLLNVQAKKIGSCIERARPYYDARIKAKEWQSDTQNAALRYDRASGQLAAAKEMVYLAEEGFFNKGQKFDPAWQEMLNHATIKVNDAERERYESEREHQKTAAMFAEAEQKVKNLQKDLRRQIAKSRPYFEMKSSVNQQMEEQKQYVSRLERQVTESKREYSTTLSSLERISDEIHRQRRLGRVPGTTATPEAVTTAPPRDSPKLGQRGVGVGAESPEEVDEELRPSWRDPLGGQHYYDENAHTEPPKPPMVILRRKRSTPAPESASVPLSVRPLTTPAVKVTAPDRLTSPDDLGDHPTVRTNAAVMDSLRRQKSRPCAVLLRSNKSSADDLLSLGGSDTESLSGSVTSASMMDDDQIQGLMLEMGEYTRFLEQLDHKRDRDKLKRRSLPCQLAAVERNFNLEDFLQELRLGAEAEDEATNNTLSDADYTYSPEEAEDVFTEDSVPPPIAEEEEDLSYASSPGRAPGETNAATDSVVTTHS